MTQTEIEIRDSYDKCKNSGMFWEIYPQLTGEWEEDKHFWLEEFFIQMERIKNKQHES